MTRDVFKMYFNKAIIQLKVPSFSIETRIQSSSRYMKQT